MKEYTNPTTLKAKYEELGSLQKTANHFKVSKKLILNYMKQFNIPRNQRVKKEKQFKPDTYHKGYGGLGGYVSGKINIKIKNKLYLYIGKKGKINYPHNSNICRFYCQF